jgi:hypothetical protein
MAEVLRLHREAHGFEHPATSKRRWIGKLRRQVWKVMDLVGGEEAATAALRAFYADAYWQERGHPFAAFVKQATRYAREAARAMEAGHGKVDAEHEFARELGRFRARRG